MGVYYFKMYFSTRNESQQGREWRGHGCAPLPLVIGKASPSGTYACYCKDQRHPIRGDFRITQWFFTLRTPNSEIWSVLKSGVLSTSLFYSASNINFGPASLIVQRFQNWFPKLVDIGRQFYNSGCSVKSARNKTSFTRVSAVIYRFAILVVLSCPH